ncbi:MAG: hypothetical protein JSR77_01035 [Planctomycetes bacterium]|nr:hypothetical protein [Planctomycetota bacterium]
MSQSTAGHRHTLPVSLAAALMTLVGGVGCIATSAMAQPPAAAADKRPDSASLLSDFIHYTRISNYDLAESMGKELMGRNPTNAEFVTMVEAGDASRFIETAQRALRVQKLEPLAASMLKAFETGKLERARNPEEITKNIGLLTSTERGKRIAEERLVFAGEYAMPQLLEAMLDNSNPVRQNAVKRVIVGLGQQSVVPLCTAMMKVTPVQQEMIADVLGQIPHKTSLPYLADLAGSSTSNAVKAACKRSFDHLGAGSIGIGEVAILYRALAEGYYAERSDLTSFPGEDNQLLWTYEPGAGLVMTAVKTPVYHEAMAMALSERAMAIESGGGSANADTLALWIASNLSREIDTPAGYDNPAYSTKGDNARRSAEYYAVAGGADVSQRVLARALTNRDTPLARRALAAVERTAGVKSLLTTGNEASPLVAALTYPNRRVQYEAALAIASAAPTEAFSGSDRVVPILASTIRGATTQTAAIITSDPEAYQGVRAILSKMGYSVMPQGRALTELAAPIAEAPAVDLVVGVGMTGDKIPAFIEEAKGTAKTQATPVFVLTSAESYIDLRRRYASDAAIAIRQAGIGEAAITETVKQLVEAASGGPISQDEATAYANRALSALRDLAVSRNPVLNAGDALLPLVAALPASQGPVKMRVADILSRVGNERAQRAVLDSATAASGPEKVAMLGLVAESGKRFGNLLEPRQVSKVVELAAKGSDEEATAAAALIGAMNLGNTELIPLIIKKK